MSTPGHVKSLATGFVLGIGFGVAVLAIAFAGFGFLTAGFFFWIEKYRPLPIAAAITGGALLLLALLIGVIGRGVLKKIKRSRPRLFSEFTGVAARSGRLAGLLIRRDPRKAMILAVVAGAVADYVTSGDKRKQ